VTLKDLTAWWRLRGLVEKPWAVARIRNDKRPGVREIRFLDGRVVRIRRRTADIQCFYRIFGLDEYGVGSPPATSLGTVIDIGSHIGLFALKASMVARRVIAIEPVQENFELLREHVRGLDHVTCLNACLAREVGTEEIFLSGRNTCHSLYKKEPGAETQAIAAITLASLFESEGVDRCDLMKLDCEGAEYPGLYNAPGELLDRIDRVVLEYHPSDEPDCCGEALAGYLEGAGFSVEMSPSKRHPRLGLMYCTRD
jgi:FkbM family methyltransferase